MRLILLLAPLMLIAQNNPGVPFTPQIMSGSGLPSICNNGNIFYNVTTSIWYSCGPNANNWNPFAFGSPSGATPGGTNGSIQWNNAGSFAGFFPQVNSVNIITPSSLNFLNSTFQGLTLGITNPSGGNVQFGLSGNLNLAGLVAIPADNVIGNFTGSSAVPSSQAVPACANDGSHALVYVSHTWTCEVITTTSGIAASQVVTDLSTLNSVISGLTNGGTVYVGPTTTNTATVVVSNPNINIVCLGQNTIIKGSGTTAIIKFTTGSSGGSVANCTVEKPGVVDGTYTPASPALWSNTTTYSINQAVFTTTGTTGTNAWYVSLTNSNTGNTPPSGGNTMYWQTLGGGPIEITGNITNMNIINNKLITADDNVAVYIHDGPTTTPGFKSQMSGNEILGGVYAERNTIGFRIEDNRIDNTPYGILGSALGLHSTASGQIVSDDTVTGNKFYAQSVFCFEAGAFGGNTPVDLIVSNNSCVNYPALTSSGNTTSGGYSFDTVADSTISANSVDANGNAVGIAGIELVRSYQNNLTGNTLIDEGYSIGDNANSNTITGGTVICKTMTGCVCGQLYLNSGYTTANNNTITNIVCQLYNHSSGNPPFWMQNNSTGDMSHNIISHWQVIGTGVELSAFVAENDFAGTFNDNLFDGNEFINLSSSGRAIYFNNGGSGGGTFARNRVITNKLMGSMNVGIQFDGNGSFPNNYIGENYLYNVVNGIYFTGYGGTATFQLGCNIFESVTGLYYNSGSATLSYQCLSLPNTITITPSNGTAGSITGNTLNGNVTGTFIASGTGTPLTFAITLQPASIFYNGSGGTTGHGWNCFGFDNTASPAIVLPQTSNGVTSCTFGGTVAVANHTITFSASPY